MVGASKILTVSYGTFSCTLEGFDEPFSTMKAIAEYFRDLAADDRYFGAEPPTPDAEMLHRIAEREIKRRVDAKIENNGVILRPHVLSQATAEPVEPSAPMEAEARVVTPDPAPTAQVAPVAKGEELTEDGGEISTAELIDLSVAAKLARIRAAVAEARETAPANIDEQHLAPYPEAAITEDFGFELEGEAPLPVVLPEPEILAQAPEQADVSAALAQDIAPKQEAEQEASEFAGEGEVEASAAADPFGQAGPLSVNQRAAKRAARRAARAAAAILAATDQPASEPAPLDAATVLQDSTPTHMHPDAPAQADAEVPEHMISTDAPLEVSATSERVNIDLAEDEAGLWEGSEISEAEGAAITATAPADGAMPSSQNDVHPSAEPVPFHARIIRIHANQAELQTEDPAADAADSAEAFAPAPQEQIEPAAGSGLSAEAEAELLRELADLQGATHPDGAQALTEVSLAPEALPLSADAHLVPQNTAAATSDIFEDEDDTLFEDIKAPAPTVIARVQRSAPEPTAEADLSRLLSETNSKLEGQENRRRFSAIAHLKAAVAATVADRKIRPGESASVESLQEARDLERYRDDLTKAVRPRRPEGPSEPATRRPALPEARPAPLVLVSEQRIDRPQAPLPSDAPVIRPRRVSVQQSAAAAYAHDEDDEDFDETPLSHSEAKSFADFAKSLGATDLPELLEAAAAFTSRVEGRPHFSRPQVIRKVASVAEDAGYSREDGLRTFGTLLRQGKIAKVKRGQFAITEASRYFVSAGRAR